MVRLYYFVAEAAGSWEISLREPEPWISPVNFATKEEAVRAASRLAKAEYTATGRPTGLRVRHGQGDWSSEVFFGDEPPAIFTPIVGARQPRG